jgi:pimeloyl-ACP methyl ester carboxylesterase
MLVTLNGAPIAFDDEGDGPALVFIHAGIADRSMWWAQRDAFAGSHRVVRLDLRGFGDSGVSPGSYKHHEDFRALLDHLGIGSATVVGISMGGDVALAFALDYPERVERLALVSTIAAMETPSDDLRALWREADAASVAGDIDRATEIEVDGWIVGKDRTRADVDAAYLECATAMIGRIWERASEATAGEEAEPVLPLATRLSELEMPVLLVRGDHDLTDVESSMARLAAGIPHAEVHVITGTAHLPPLECPAEFNARLRAFLS